jgi:phosphoenolpyruvate-protein kinase (PTS system EI component)
VAEIMVPLVASVGEFKIIKRIIDKTAAAIQKEDPSFPRENMEKNRKNMKKKVELVVSNLSTFWNQLSVTIIIPSASSAFYSLISSRRT